MKIKKHLIYIFISFLLVLIVTLYTSTSRPYNYIYAETIANIKLYDSVYGTGGRDISGKEVDEQDIQKCIQAVNNIKDFRLGKEPSEPIAGGYKEGFDILFKNGKKLSIYTASENQIIVNDCWYSADIYSIKEFELVFEELRLSYFPNHKHQKYFEQNIGYLKEYLASN